MDWSEYFYDERPIVPSELKYIESVLPEEFKAVFAAFGANLRGVLRVATLPYNIQFEAVKRQVFQQLLLEERIKRTTYEEVVDPPAENPAEDPSIYKDVAARFHTEYWAGADCQRKLRNVVEERLSDLAEVDTVRSAARDILRQCIVLTWAALEVLATDAFVALLNLRPAVASMLTRDENTKKFFPLRDFVAILEEHSYDVSRKMGNVLVGQRRLDDITVIRAVFRVLFPSEDVQTLLQDERLWKLNQRRNLIVHRRGIVDRSYLLNTGDTLELGAELAITPPFLKESIELIRDIGVAIGKELSSSTSPPHAVLE